MLAVSLPSDPSLALALALVALGCGCAASLLVRPYRDPHESLMDAACRGANVVNASVALAIFGDAIGGAAAAWVLILANTVTMVLVVYVLNPLRVARHAWDFRHRARQGMVRDALFTACERGDLAVLRAYHDDDGGGTEKVQQWGRRYGMRLEDVCVRSTGVTLLHSAAKAGAVETVQFLCGLPDAAHMVRARNYDNLTPQLVALRELAHALHTGGAGVDGLRGVLAHFEALDVDAADEVGVAAIKALGHTAVQLGITFGIADDSLRLERWGSVPRAAVDIMVEALPRDHGDFAGVELGAYGGEAVAWRFRGAQFAAPECALEALPLSGDGLEALRLAGNPLLSLSLADASRLRVADLSGCGATSWDLSTSPALEELRLDDTTAPQGAVLAGCGALRALSLAGCSLTAADVDVDVGGLQDLDLSRCGLRSLAGLRGARLERLIASFNPLESFPWSSSFPALRRLGLRGCGLSQLPAGQFSFAWLDLGLNGLDDATARQACALADEVRLDEARVEARGLRVSSSRGAAYSYVPSMDVGARMFGDRPNVVKTSTLGDFPGIATANDDKNWRRGTLLSFVLDRDCDVYLMLTKRAPQPPAWVTKAGFEPTQETINGFVGHKKRFAAGTRVALGGAKCRRSKNAYFVVLVDGTVCSGCGFSSGLGGSGLGGSGLGGSGGCVRCS